MLSGQPLFFLKTYENCIDLHRVGLRASVLKSFMKFQLSALYFSSIKEAPPEPGKLLYHFYKRDAPLERFLIPLMSVVLTPEESRVYRMILITLLRLR